MGLFGTPLDEGELNERQAAEVFCEIGRRCWAKNFVEANGGNFSYRLADGRILATPTMISKGFMEPADMVVLDVDGNQIGGTRQKTSEILTHLTFYQHRPDVRSVVHAHPRHASAFAVTITPIPKCVIPEVEIFVGEIPIAAYETPGTPKLSARLMPYIRDFDVFLLANHGAVALGRSILEAYWRMEILDAYCQTILLARQLGGVSQVTDEHMRELFQLKERIGFHDRRIADPIAARCDVDAPCVGRENSGLLNAPTAPRAGPRAGSPPQPLLASSVIPSPSPDVVDAITREVLTQLQGKGLL